MQLNIDLPKLRALVVDIQIGTLNDSEKIGTEIQIWEAIRSWAVLYRKSMDLVQELGNGIDRDSYFARDIIGTKTLDGWLANPAGLQTEKEKLTVDLAEMGKLITAMRKGKH